ncbi:unnamed protein product [Rotaria sp. Silwood2]|nr:unnamed protein product [Rotaria sp. Silwood2]CAF2963888.1 unnamed protein product [Rotaria sp. Silwood2]CAF3323811.1 unnamed protein product [Rotaria sp. Silwood2]CAF3365551.1 unnamed protein product [Rotaria sp. Silwood2]CAF4335074.1 unnamed protein product [Rotaria sp. Silwood2]
MKRCDLEPNHSHFLLFDGEASSAHSVLFQRAEIEKHSRRINATMGAFTPIVMVLVEGGALSIRTICQALESNTPLVVVKVST